MFLNTPEKQLYSSYLPTGKRAVGFISRFHKDWCEMMRKKFKFPGISIYSIRISDVLTTSMPTGDEEDNEDNWDELEDTEE